MKVPSVKVQYYSYPPLAQKYHPAPDALHIPMNIRTNPISLAGKLIKFLSREDEVRFISEGLSKTAILNAFTQAGLRAHNTLIAFVNDRTIRSDLVMFDYTTESAVLKKHIDGFPSLYLETAWYMQTKKEDVYIELYTRLVKSSIPVAWTERLRNWITKKGTTSKNIPSLKYILTLKVFDTPASCYAIDLHEFDIEVPYSEKAFEVSNLDLFDPAKITQKAKERYESRRVYFRKG